MIISGKNERLQCQINVSGVKSSISPSPLVMVGIIYFHGLVWPTAFFAWLKDIADHTQPSHHIATKADLRWCNHQQHDWKPCLMAWRFFKFLLLEGNTMLEGFCRINPQDYRPGCHQVAIFNGGYLDPRVLSNVLPDIAEEKNLNLITKDWGTLLHSGFDYFFEAMDQIVNQWPVFW